MLSLTAGGRSSSQLVRLAATTFVTQIVTLSVASTAVTGGGECRTSTQGLDDLALEESRAQALILRRTSEGACSLKKRNCVLDVAPALPFIGSVAH
jgi:hypothetical protein